jgi:hypothetical protein
MNFEEVLSAISNLAAQHSKSGDQVEDLKDTDWLENDAFNLIIDYCKEKNYQVNGFPDSITNDDSTEISEEHWMLYVDKLTLTNSDVAELHWHWVSSFWPDQFKDKEEFVESISQRLSGGFYDITL